MGAAGPGAPRGRQPAGPAAEPLHAAVARHPRLPHHRGVCGDGEQARAARHCGLAGHRRASESRIVQAAVGVVRLVVAGPVSVLVRSRREGRPGRAHVLRHEHLRPRRRGSLVGGRHRGLCDRPPPGRQPPGVEAAPVEVSAALLRGPVDLGEPGGPALGPHLHQRPGALRALQGAPDGFQEGLLADAAPHAGQVQPAGRDGLRRLCLLAQGLCGLRVSQRSDQFSGHLFGALRPPAGGAGQAGSSGRSHGALLLQPVPLLVPIVLRGQLPPQVRPTPTSAGLPHVRHRSLWRGAADRAAERAGERRNVLSGRGAAPECRPLRVAERAPQL
mmetsp:Transcript_47351/g.145844  ORF Transcript_47351/g.145844 Transcript_47351/m.145844 type:complete len:331 (+) Transcript_47351:131-1123(+)